jgi:predicted transcriptional regulator
MTDTNTTAALEAGGEAAMCLGRLGASTDEMATAIVAAYVSNNSLPKTELPELILLVRGALEGVTTGPALAEPAVTKPTAAEIKKSLKPDGIVSFIDGRTYKTLKRHLTANGMGPESYRTQFGLPHDYPMVAPSYAAQRSELAKAIGLGQPGGIAKRKAAKSA